MERRLFIKSLGLAGAALLVPEKFMGVNQETPKRISDIGELCLQLREGQVKGEVQEGGMLKNVYAQRGVRLNYNDEGVR